MTNTKNLANLAAALDDGTSGQVLQSTGSGGVQFADSSGSGVTVFTGLSGTDGTPANATYLLNASSPSAGDLAYVSSNTSLYQNNGNGWYRIAVINTTPTISSVADASSNTTPFTLVGGTNTVITVTASDADEGTDLTYSHSVTSGSLNGTTVTQGTGANENVFTIAPHSSNATTFSITFTVSDSINAATSVSEFTLTFAPDWSSSGSSLESTLTSSGMSGLGNSISISRDYGTVAVGAHKAYSDKGAVVIYTRSGSTWSQEAILTHTNGVTADYFGGRSDGYGQCVSLQDDGNRVVVGALADGDTAGTGQGTAWVFTRSGTTWSLEQKLVASDAASSDNFGSFVSIDSDGDTILVGAKEENSSRGKVYLFTRSGTTWTEQQNFTASDVAASDNFGNGGDLSADGNTAVIGSWYDDDDGGASGSAYIFTRSGNTFSQAQKITASDASAGVYFGRHCATSSNGNTILVTGYRDANGGTFRGAVYIFTKSGSTWSQTAKLTPSVATDNQYFGRSADISDDGTIVAIGCQGVSNNSTHDVYIFQLSSGTWSQVQQLRPDTGAAANASISINDEERIAIGSNGKAWVYVAS